MSLGPTNSTSASLRNSLLQVLEDCFDTSLSMEILQKIKGILNGNKRLQDAAHLLCIASGITAGIVIDFYGSTYQDHYDANLSTPTPDNTQNQGMVGKVFPINAADVVFYAATPLATGVIAQGIAKIFFSGINYIRYGVTNSKIAFDPSELIERISKANPRSHLSTPTKESLIAILKDCKIKMEKNFTNRSSLAYKEMEDALARLQDELSIDALLLLVEIQLLKKKHDKELINKLENLLSPPDEVDAADNDAPITIERNKSLLLLVSDPHAQLKRNLIKRNSTPHVVYTAEATEPEVVKEKIEQDILLLHATLEKLHIANQALSPMMRRRPS